MQALKIKEAIFAYSELNKKFYLLKSNIIFKFNFIKQQKVMYPECK